MQVQVLPVLLMTVKAVAAQQLWVTTLEKTSKKRAVTRKTMWTAMTARMLRKKRNLVKAPPWRIWMIRAGPGQRMPERREGGGASVAIVALAPCD